MLQGQEVTGVLQARSPFASMHRRNISRIDNDTNRTHAWCVQVRRKNHVDIKMFSDGVYVYGGKRMALRAAIKYHTHLMQNIQPYEYQIWWV